MEYYSDNVLFTDEQMNDLIQKESPINKVSEINILYSSLFELNPHAKMMIEKGNIYIKEENPNEFKVYISGYTKNIVNKIIKIPKNAKIELDIRSMNLDTNDKIIDIMKPFLKPYIFDVEYKSNCLAQYKILNDNKKIYFSLNKPYLTKTEKHNDITKGIYSDANIVIILNKKSFDPKCTLTPFVLKYIEKHFQLKKPMFEYYDRILSSVVAGNLNFNISIGKIL